MEEMNIRNLFENLLIEMTQKELDEKKKQLEAELREVRAEYQSADGSNRSRILQKLQSVRTKLNSLKMMRPVEDKLRIGDKSDPAAKKEILKRRKMHLYRTSEDQERRKA